MITGCGTPKVVMDYQKDSVTLIVRDSVIFRDSVVLVEIPKESEKAVVFEADTSFLETTFAQSTAWVNGGKLYHTLQNKDALVPIEVKLPKYIHTEQKGITKTIREVVEVEKELSKWQSFIQALGYIVLIAVFAWIAWKLSKIIRA